MERETKTMSRQINVTSENSSGQCLLLQGGFSFALALCGFSECSCFLRVAMLSCISPIFIKLIGLIVHAKIGQEAP